MKNHGLIFLATLATASYEEVKHPSDKREHTHQESHLILAPHTVNVYSISGKIKVIEVNGAALATQVLGLL